ncbi:hypothetical protein [Perigonia lusca single nucleopolyhedrovirus]|uniref:Uncharacterized protein n=1 Tax=Perigonia lusca single nucleopolyhedrovirus TaxID=1675865 RepID=A0A0M3WN57_9ABAC|nr:hypothetical protein [Perigonia lusca single nucleopolyhedrovirus]AKN80688.1 hypothetical protein [Perigonia lusca single nucleopolyhedrovirus]
MHNESKIESAKLLTASSSLSSSASSSTIPLRPIDKITIQKYNYTITNEINNIRSERATNVNDATFPTSK